MLEWRVDYLLNQEDFHATKDLETAYAVIRRHFKDVPLLTTVRTKSQGGAHKTPGGEYVSLLSLIIVRTGRMCSMWSMGMKCSIRRF